MERKQGQVKLQISDKTTTVEIELEILVSKLLMLYFCMRTVPLKNVWHLEIFLIVSSIKIWAATPGN